MVQVQHHAHATSCICAMVLVLVLILAQRHDRTYVRPAHGQGMDQVQVERMFDGMEKGQVQGQRPSFSQPFRPRCPVWVGQSAQDGAGHLHYACNFLRSNPSKGESVTVRKDWRKEILGHLQAHRDIQEGREPVSKLTLEWTIYRRGVIRRKRMTPEEYEKKLLAQGGVCALCGSPPGERALGIDHDHECCPEADTCGQCNRDLLCGNCNSGLGYFQDSPELLRKAADYIEMHRRDR